ncbi:hypothetical protein E4U48_002287 [Claviceps purpurea]|nr:hypothetical protein E4U37_004403 [Claviceps purpurea]KAG6223056.1 hypothetical protein E4U26_004800 [Claviceps purpurea]KAG6265227.1 hypothetical protein E4U49_001124 [Claviceps purpurea]KAG6282997.1 hypothetical protein E4U48_002287 [Claviceps purpurea]KAG6285035.1 hypothetical protein E4U46_006274 [Claviceps purpurea]
MDITPCTSVRVALDYIAKYCMKAEVPTASYTDIVKSVLPHVSDSRPVVSLAAKNLNKLLVERDWGSQEVAFLLVDLALVEGSRVVLTLDCRAEQDRDAVVDVPGTDGVRQSTRPRRSLYVKYLERDEEYEATTLFTFLTRHNTNRPQPQRLADWVPDRILRYVPRYHSDPEHP